LRIAEPYLSQICEDEAVSTFGTVRAVISRSENIFDADLFFLSLNIELHLNLVKVAKSEALFQCHLDGVSDAILSHNVSVTCCTTLLLSIIKLDVLVEVSTIRISLDADSFSLLPSFKIAMSKRGGR
jgi:hypothetical protein